MFWTDRQPTDLLMTVGEACIWASQAVNRKVSTANIQYLVNYGRLTNYGQNGRVMVSVTELEVYYSGQMARKERWQSRLGNDLNWSLSFDEYAEAERTKHVHRLHPYKGKFIPQLVEYFLDDHIDEFKTDVWFRPGDVILDPFCGSGTTLIQASELGMHAVGIDVSEFNSWVTNVKLSDVDVRRFLDVARIIAAEVFSGRELGRFYQADLEFREWLSDYNRKWFPSPIFKQKLRSGAVEESIYAEEHLPRALNAYEELVHKYGIDSAPLGGTGFLDRWFARPIRTEMQMIADALANIDNPGVREALRLVLSRTIRSCRATTHADLGTLKEPVLGPYYCAKHGKICTPLVSMASWWNRYAKDTAKRLSEFSTLRTATDQWCITGDARKVDVVSELSGQSPRLAQRVNHRKFDGIFTSPPYVGLIDYHEQHAYAYELLGFERRDGLEIGRKSDGLSLVAKNAYVDGVAAVLANVNPMLADDANVFVVANDRHGLYDSISDISGMKIVNRFERPVLNRVEKDRSAYSETIFHMKPC